MKLDEAQGKTLAQLLLLIVGLPLLALIYAGILEVKTLADDKKDNHITAVLQAVWKQQPGAYGLVVLFWGLVFGVVMYVSGHAFWPAIPTPEAVQP